MRGKNAMWLALVAMLLTVALTPIATGAPKPRLCVSPSEIDNEDMHLSSFPIDIIVEDAKDLYSYAFIVDYQPYLWTLSAVSAIEGPFLKEEGILTDFVFTIDHFHGEMKIGNARLGDVPGVDGTGTLATVMFSVVGPGSSPLDLIEVELYNSDGDLMETRKSCDGNYYGSRVRFDGIKFDPGVSVNLKNDDALDINTTFTNVGQIELDVRVRYDIWREDTLNRFYCGQTFRSMAPEPEYLYVDGYYEWIEGGWTNPGASLIGEPDDNYAESTVACSLTSMYTFEDISLGTRLITNVDLQGYTCQPDGTDNDFDPYAFSYYPNGSMGLDFDWCDSMGGSSGWKWTGGRYYGGSAYDMPEYYDKYLHLHTEQGINSVEVLLHNYGASGPRMQIDAMRWKVEFAKVAPVDPGIYTVGPGETGWCVGTWALESHDVGEYDAAAYLEYRCLMGYDAGGNPLYSAWVTAKEKGFHVKIFDSSK